MTTRRLGGLFAILGLVMLALVKLSKNSARDPRARRDGEPAVRRFGRRKGEPLPLMSRRRQRPAASE
jgi:hypothetical protein